MNNSLFQTAYLQCLHKHDNSSSAFHNETNSTVNPLLEAVTLTTLSNLSNETTNGTTISPIEPTTIAPPLQLVCIEPWSFVAGDVLSALWRIVYWTSQVLTWFILPILQSYCMAGDFTILRKLKSSFVENIIFYGIGAVTFLFFLVYVAIKKGLSVDSLKVICITASNTWGLLLLSVLLGYGLVEIPKSIYEASKQTRKLNYLYFKVAKLSAEKCEAEEKLEDALEQIQHTYEAVVTNHQHLRHYMDIILTKCPDDWTNKLIAKYNNSEEQSRASSRAVTYSEADLVRLHSNILKSTQAVNRVRLQWDYLIEQVFEWEDVAKNQLNPTRIFKHTHEEPVKQSSIWRSVRESLYTPHVEWYWKCRIRSPLYKCIGVVLAVFSFVVVWSEMTFSITNPKLSVFALLHDAARRRESYFVIEILSISSIAYLCICTYYTVFKIRVFNYYYLASHHQTDEYSLIFCGMLLCRLTPPLCLNFLGLMHLDSHIVTTIDEQPTAFTGIMGHMDVIGFISGGFNVYLPIVMCLFCLATFLEVGSRFLHFMGIEQFIVDDEMTADLIKDGSDLVKRESNKRTKLLEGRSRWTGGTSREISSSVVRPPVVTGSTTSTTTTTASTRVSSDPTNGDSNRGVNRHQLIRENSGESARIELLGDDSEGIQSYSTLQHQPNRNIFDDL